MKRIIEYFLSGCEDQFLKNKLNILLFFNLFFGVFVAAGVVLQNILFGVYSTIIPFLFIEMGIICSFILMRNKKYKSSIYVSVFVFQTIIPITLTIFDFYNADFEVFRISCVIAVFTIISVILLSNSRKFYIIMVINLLIVTFSFIWRYINIGSFKIIPGHITSYFASIMGLCLLGMLCKLLVNLFATMIEDLKYERCLSEKRLKIIEKYTNKTLVEHIKDGSSHDTLKPEHKELAILFLDLRGFTNITEKLSSEEINDLLTDYYTIVCDTVYENSGLVYKMVGDRLLMYFEKCSEAVRCLERILEKIEYYNINILDKSDIKFNVGMGITYGKVRIGNVGSSRKSDFTIIGEAVNVASKIQLLTKLYDIPVMISEEVIEKLKGDSSFHIRFLDHITLKDYSKSIKLFECISKNGVFDTSEEDIDIFLNEAYNRYKNKEFSKSIYIYNKLLSQMKDNNIHNKDRMIEFFVSRCKYMENKLIKSKESLSNWIGIYEIAV